MPHSESPLPTLPSRDGDGPGLTEAGMGMGGRGTSSVVGFLACGCIAPSGVSGKGNSTSRPPTIHECRSEWPSPLQMYTPGLGVRRVRWAVTTDTVGGSGQVSRGDRQLHVDVSDAASLSRRMGVPRALLDVGAATAVVMDRGLGLLAEACAGP